MTAAESGWQQNPAAPAHQVSTVANLVIPVDGSELSRSAIPIARGLAQVYKATPHLIYVGERSIGSEEVLNTVGVTTEDMPGMVLDAYKGDAAEAILDSARGLPESLIVMCTHTVSHHRTDCFGSVAESVLAANPERIVLVAPERGHRSWTIQNVLLSHDGSPSCDAATAPAAEIAQRTGAQIVALHVAAPRTTCPQQAGSLPAPRYVDQPQHEWPAWVTEFKDRMLALGAAPSSLHFKLLVASGQPGSEIARVACERQVDLVVMAWNGRWNTTKHMPPRVVVRTSGCPVLLVYSSV